MTTVAPNKLRSEKIELVLSQLDALPPLSPIAAKILILTEDSRTNAQQIIELIRSDPPLTARVLSILGRSQRGVKSDALNIQNAVLMLGFPAIRRITLASKVMGAFSSPDESDAATGFDRAEFWKHCLAVACAARSIAAALPGRVEAEEAFVCGLLHDIGKIALETAMPKSFARIVRKADETRADIADVEREFLGVDHTVVGHRLGERWGLPEVLIESMWLHHQLPEALPPSVAAGKHVQIVQLADVIAREQRIGYSGNYRMIYSSRELAEGLGLDGKKRQAILESLGEEIEERAPWIGAEGLNTREVYLRALMQTTEELSAANAALSERNQRLEKESDYFAALRALNHMVSPRASVREVCAAGAAALRGALGLPSVLVFVTSEDGRWAEIGLCDGERSSTIAPRPAAASPEGEHAANAVQMADAGIWIAPPGDAFSHLVDRYQGRLGQGRTWLLPIVRKQRWVGGVLFAAPEQRIASLRTDSAELGALSAALGLAISQAQAQTAARALGDELAEVNRRMVAMHRELLRTKTLETVVAMAAGAAHELNNPLTVILGRAQLLRDSVQDGDVRETLDTITRQAQRCSNIVTELMEFAQPRQADPESVDLPACLEELEAQLATEGLLEAGHMTCEIASDTPSVWFDREQLAGLFREVLLNAIEATHRDSRRLTIKASPHLTEECVAVSVIDNGRGMTAKVLAHAMDPFFSARPAGRGRGLGLARVQRCLRHGGGSIRIDSQPDHGTRVELSLPLANPDRG